MRIHNKQFVVSSRAIQVHDDWLSESLHTNLYLSYCPAARIVRVHDLDRTAWFMIGTATAYDVSLEEPHMSIAHLHTHEVENASMKWAGRWCLISHRCIITDATNLIGLVYDEEKEMLASSVSLLDQLLTARLSLPPIPLKQSYYHNWYLLPLTGYKRVRKLLPQQKMVWSHTNSWTTETRKYAMVECAGYSYEDLYEELKISLENEIRYLSLKSEFRLHVALSGGYDSRLILALATTTGRPFSCYTHTFETIKLSDYTTPALLCPRHRYIPARKADPERLRLFDWQNGQHALDMDRLFFSQGQWDTFEQGDVCLRGGILELAGYSQAHLYDRVGELEFEDIDARLFNYSLKDYRPFQIHSLTEFFGFQRNNPLTGFDFNKVYYINQRIAGWLSYIETGLDLLPSTSYNLGNSIYQINLMNALPAKVKKIKGFHIDYMYRNQPHLLEFPFNSATLMERVKGFINRKSKSLIFRR